MKTKHILGILCVSWAAFALPAAAQNGRQNTPATMNGCDELADATPGLQGLCVALCEAQACEAKVNSLTHEVEYGPGCEPSAPRLLANYTKLAERGENNPKYPFCVKVTCPCWTQPDLEAIGGGGDVSCIGEEDVWVRLQSENDGGFANASFGECRLNRTDFDPIIGRNLGPTAYDQCLKTAIAECAARKRWPPE